MTDYYLENAEFAPIVSCRTCTAGYGELEMYLGDDDSLASAVAKAQAHHEKYHREPHLMGDNT